MPKDKGPIRFGMGRSDMPQNIDDAVDRIFGAGRAPRVKPKPSKGRKRPPGKK